MDDLRSKVSAETDPCCCKWGCTCRVRDGKCHVCTTKEKQKEPKLNDSECPYCKSENVSASLPESDTNVIWVTADCADCKHEWRWVYSLSEVELVSTNVSVEAAKCC